MDTNITISPVSIIEVSQNNFPPILIGGYDDHSTKDKEENMSGKCQFPGCSFHEDRGGYCVRHSIFAGPKVKAAPKPIAKVSKKKKAELKEQKPQRDLQVEWFEVKVSELTNVCMECGGPTKCGIYVYEKATVAHVLPKRPDFGFPSVATHEHNSLELCNTNGCHHRYDSSWETASTMKVWPIAVDKFKQMYPSIAAPERKFIPDILLQELEP